MFILRHEKGNDFFTSFEEASDEFSSWKMGSLEDALENEFSGISGVEINISNPADFSCDIMHMLFYPENSQTLLPFDGLAENEKNTILDMYRELHTGL